MKNIVIILVFGFMSMSLIGCTSSTGDNFYKSNGIVEECTDKSADPNCAPSEDLHLYDGIYEVGVDIQPGLYRFHATQAPGTIKRINGEITDVVEEMTLSSWIYVEVETTDTHIEIINGALLAIEDVTYFSFGSKAVEGGYLVGSEIPPGDYTLKLDDGIPTGTLEVYDYADLDLDSISQTFIITEGDELIITITSDMYMIFITNAYLVPTGQ